jgi:hypothetical protein
MIETIWVKSKAGTSLWHIYKNSDKNKWRDTTVTWTECLCQLDREVVTSPVPPMYERGSGKTKYWMKRVCRNCQAYYREVLSANA